MNGLNLYFPDVPVIPLSLNAGAFFTETPWNQMQAMSITILPLMVGLAFLLTAEVSLSLWSFIWIMQFQLDSGVLSGLFAGDFADGDWPSGRWRRCQIVSSVSAMRRVFDVTRRSSSGLDASISSTSRNAPLAARRALKPKTAN